MDQKIIKKTQNVTHIFPHGDSEPFKVIIIKSGWRGMYHVISEWGDSEETIHKLMDSNQIIDFYRLDIIDLPSGENYCLTKEEILNHPNDSDLGEFVRKKIYS
jgi:hypothetical protein